MTKNSVFDVERLRTLRTSIHALALLQQELRRAVEQRRAEDQPPKPVGTIAREIVVSWRNLKGFLDREHVLCGNATVQRISHYANRPEIAEKICALTKVIPDRFLGVASAIPEAIDCAFDLEEAWIARAETLDQESFASVFQDHAATVLGAIRHARTALTALENPVVRETIRTIIAEASFTSSIASATATNADRRHEKGARLTALVATLNPRYTFRHEIADKLGVCKTTLIAAMKGAAGEKTIDELITKTKALVSASACPPQGVVAPAPPAPKVNAQPPTSALEVLEKLGGETSPLGVRFVLGPNSFREIEIEEIGAFITFALRQIELARIMLNVGAQIKDEATRRRIRETFGKEVEELELAIRSFTTRYPNRLTRLHQGEREAWAAVGGAKPQRKE